jgi:hypothetical protein
MTLVLMLGASLALAQELPGGRIGMFADQAGTDCSIADSAPGLLAVYVVHIGTTGATASQYIAAKPGCMTGSYLSDTNPFAVTVGNSQTGVSVGYGTCRAGSIHCQTISYFAAGTTPTCCIYPIKCDPLGVDACASGLVDIVNCDFQPALAKAQSAVVNEAAACQCLDIVAEEDSSWGQIKALFNE